MKNKDMKLLEDRNKVRGRKTCDLRNKIYNIEINQEIFKMSAKEGNSMIICVRIREKPFMIAANKKNPLGKKGKKKDFLCGSQHYYVALLLQWLWLDPWLRNFHIPQVQPQEKKKKEKKNPLE